MIKEIDGRTLRKICVRLSLSTYTGIDYYLGLSIYELSEVAEEIRQVVSKK